MSTANNSPDRQQKSQAASGKEASATSGREVCPQTSATPAGAREAQAAQSADATTKQREAPADAREAQVLAWLFGELSVREADALEEAFACDPDLAAVRDELETAIAWMDDAAAAGHLKGAATADAGAAGESDAVNRAADDPADEPSPDGAPLRMDAAKRSALLTALAGDRRVAASADRQANAASEAEGAASETQDASDGLDKAAQPPPDISASHAPDNFDADRPDPAETDAPREADSCAEQAADAPGPDDDDAGEILPPHASEAPIPIAAAPAAPAALANDAPAPEPRRRVVPFPRWAVGLGGLAAMFLLVFIPLNDFSDRAFHPAEQDAVIAATSASTGATLDTPPAMEAIPPTALEYVAARSSRADTTVTADAGIAVTTPSAIERVAGGFDDDAAPVVAFAPESSSMPVPAIDDGPLIDFDGNRDLAIGDYSPDEVMVAGAGADLVLNSEPEIARGVADGFAPGSGFALRETVDAREPSREHQVVVAGEVAIAEAMAADDDDADTEVAEIAAQIAASRRAPATGLDKAFPGTVNRLRQHGLTIASPDADRETGAKDTAARRETIATDANVETAEVAAASTVASNRALKAAEAAHGQSSGAKATKQAAVNEVQLRITAEQSSFDYARRQIAQGKLPEAARIDGTQFVNAQQLPVALVAPEDDRGNALLPAQVTRGNAAPAANAFSMAANTTPAEATGDEGTEHAAPGAATAAFSSPAEKRKPQSPAEPGRSGHPIASASQSAEPAPIPSRQRPRIPESPALSVQTLLAANAWELARSPFHDDRELLLITLAPRPAPEATGYRMQLYNTLQPQTPVAIVRFTADQVDAFRLVGEPAPSPRKQITQGPATRRIQPIPETNAGNQLLFLITPAESGARDIATVLLRSADDPDAAPIATYHIARPDSVPPLSEASPQMRLAAAAGFFAEWLANRETSGRFSPEDFADILKGTGTEPLPPQAQDLLTMIEQAAKLRAKE